MDNWKGTLLQIIGVLLGSSLVLGLVNNFISTWNQPDINISVNSHSNDFSYPTYLFRNLYLSEPEYIDIQLMTDIRNVGISPATGLYINLKFPQLNLIDYDIISSEDVARDDLTYTTKEMEMNLTKLGSGGNIFINSTFRIYNSSSSFNNYYNALENEIVYESNCEITVTDEKKTEKFKCRETQLFQSTLYKPEYPVLIFLGLTVLFVYIYSTQKIKNYKLNKRNSDFVALVKDDISRVFHIFNNDIISRKIFSYNWWYLIPEDEKRHIFNNYNDYKKINQLYTEMKNRDNAFSYEVDEETLSVYNSRILNLATDLRNIQWDGYYISKEITSKSIPILLIFLLFSISLSIIEILSLTISNYLFSFFSRLLYSALILYLIFRFNIIQSTLLRPSFFYKILPICVGILSIPIVSISIFIISPFFESTIDNFHNTSFITTFSILLLDIVRVYFTFKLFAKETKESINELKKIFKFRVLTGSLSIIVGLFFLLSIDYRYIITNPMYYYFASVAVIFFFFGIMDIRIKESRFYARKVFWIKFYIISINFEIIFLYVYLYFINFFSVNRSLNILEIVLGIGFVSSIFILFVLKIYGIIMYTLILNPFRGHNNI